jgi:hypothetical protein
MTRSNNNNKIKKKASVKWDVDRLCKGDSMTAARPAVFPLIGPIHDGMATQQYL